MEQRFTTPSRVFPVTGGGAGINANHRCSHDRPSVSFHLFSDLADSSEDIAFLIPTCAASALFGSALAYLEACEGQAAVDEFLEEMSAARKDAARLLTARAAQDQATKGACCEASVRTHGLEHTCRSTPAA
ncbi:hypothetical protein [Streptomyces sp. NPDC056160]|uniref:hypothetical protein n=1 Tax=Streptomyces sp. NPDC056160 TaxID=3345731 RepID=UPI0035D75551